MNVRERVYAALEGKMPDHLPQLVYSNFLPRGSFERKLRDMGLGLDMRCSVHRTLTPNVKSETKVVGDFEYVETTTPGGVLRSARRINMTFQNPGGSWRVERPVKGLDDVDALKSMIDDTEYEPNYDNYTQIEAELGGDGVVTVGASYTPLMRLIVEYLGFRTFARMLIRSPDILDELVDLLDKSYVEMYKVIAESPAEIVRIGDNTDEVIISPALYEKYVLPYYNSYSRTLRKSGKKVISHMDGRLKGLKELIAATELDAIEAFTPPPTGNLPIAEAKGAWEGKALWLNFPEVVFLEPPDRIRDFTRSLMAEMGDGSGYIVSITEDIHPDHYHKAMETLTRTIHDFGRLPLGVS